MRKKRITKKEKALIEKFNNVISIDNIDEAIDMFQSVRMTSNYNVDELSKNMEQNKIIYIYKENDTGIKQDQNLIGFGDSDTIFKKLRIIIREKKEVVQIYDLFNKFEDSDWKQIDMLVTFGKYLW